jgi:cytochrome P450
MNPSVDRLEVTDLSDPVMFSDPFPRYASLRVNAPLSRVKSRQLVRGRGGYLLTRYDDVMTVHTDKRFSSDIVNNSRAGGMIKYLPRMLRLLTDSMVFKDDPDHKRLRGLVSRAFTPKMVDQMAGGIGTLVEGLVDDLAAKGQVDLIDEFATPLPLAVISEMLGVNDDDRDAFHASAKRFIDSSSAGPAQLLAALPAAQRMLRLFERLAERGRTAPDDRLISALVRANDEGDHLSDQEVLAMIFLLLLAGHDTTANLIGNGTLALLDHPDQLARLRQHPELIDLAVEELLRFTSPVTCGAARIALEDVDIAGSTIPKGSQVLGMIISANRDEDVFTDPGALDVGRDPNRHLAFAFGAHYCLGNQLARLEGRIAINALIQRFESIELTVAREELRYKSTQSLRGLRSLPVALHE